MTLIAIKEHGYRGRRIALGQKYEVGSPSDAYILQKARLAKLYVPSEKEVKKKEVKAVLPMPTPAVNTREEEPEIVEEEDDGDFNEFNESPIDSPSQARKQKRQYKRKDMVPEK